MKRWKVGCGFDEIILFGLEEWWV